MHAALSTRLGTGTGIGMEPFSTVATGLPRSGGDRWCLTTVAIQKC